MGVGVGVGVGMGVGVGVGVGLVLWPFAGRGAVVTRRRLSTASFAVLATSPTTNNPTERNFTLNFLSKILAIESNRSRSRAAPEK